MRNNSQHCKIPSCTMPSYSDANYVKISLKKSILIALVLGSATAFSGCAALISKPAPDTYDISAPTTFPNLIGKSRAQILILEPSALKVLDSDQIVIKPNSATVEYLARSQWTDRVPKVIQAKLIETFENTQRVKAIAKPGEGLVIDYQIVSNIRAFQVNLENGVSQAQVAISVKLVSDRTGKVVRSNVFNEVVPLASTNALDVVTAIDAAFDKVARDIVAWTFAGV